MLRRNEERCLVYAHSERQQDNDEVEKTRHPNQLKEFSMLKKVGDNYYMITTKKSLFEGFIYKVSELRNYSIKISRWTKTLTFENEEEALRCRNEIRNRYDIGWGKNETSH